MPYDSPLANPDVYVAKIDILSNEGVTIDKGIATVKRDAEELASKYSSDFSLVTTLADYVKGFNDTWVYALQQTRDSASSLSAWIDGFDKVFLDMTNDIASESDAKDVIAEFTSLNNEEKPSARYDLSKCPGVKSAWSEIEGLVVGESNYVIQTLEGQGWKTAVEELKKQTPAVKSGIQKIRQALNKYATTLE